MSNNMVIVRDSNSVDRAVVNQMDLQHQVQASIDLNKRSISQKLKNASRIGRIANKNSKILRKAASKLKIM